MSQTRTDIDCRMHVTSRKKSPWRKKNISGESARLQGTWGARVAIAKFMQNYITSINASGLHFHEEDEGHTPKENVALKYNPRKCTCEGDFARTIAICIVSDASRTYFFRATWQIFWSGGKKSWTDTHPK